MCKLRPTIADIALLVVVCLTPDVYFDNQGQSTTNHSILVVNAEWHTKPVDFSEFGIVTQTIDLDLIKIGDQIIIFGTGIVGISINLTGPLFKVSGSIQIALRDFKFDIYDLNGRLVSDDCDADYFADKNIAPFSDMQNIYIAFLMNTISTRKPICPYFFRNFNVPILKFYNYENNLLQHNILSERDIHNPHNRQVILNVNLFQVQFEGVYRIHFVSFSMALLNRALNYYFRGVFTFDQDFFRNLPFMNDILLKPENPEEFFHSSLNKWLASLFADKPSYESKASMIEHVRISPDFLRWSVYNPTIYYNYPDEDFCLFKHFPSSRAIISDLYLEPPYVNVSCTYKYLSQNNKILLEIFGQQSGDVAVYDDSVLNECDFERRLAFCANLSISIKLSTPRFNIYDFVYVVKWVEFVGPIITFPILSGVAFLLNLLVILVIRSKANKKEKLFEARSFRFIEMNSAFNCIECFIYQFRLMSICFGVNALYCSPIRLSAVYFFFEAVMIYLGEVMKSCSMLTGLMFSLQRYIEATKTKNKRLNAFASYSTRRLLLATMAYGLVVSVPIEFDIDIIHRKADSFYDIPSRFYVKIEEYFEHQAQAYMYFGHYILNDVVILLLNLAVDGLLVRHIKADLRRKLQGQLDMRVIHDSEGTRHESDNKKLKKEKEKKALVERKANMMIVLSVVIYIFCRMPEIIGSFVLFYFSILSREWAGTCELGFYCSLISNLIEYMYMLAYISNIFIYYKFNKNFQRGFRIFFRLETE